MSARFRSAFDFTVCHTFNHIKGTALKPYELHGLPR